MLLLLQYYSYYVYVVWAVFLTTPEFYGIAKPLLLDILPRPPVNPSLASRPRQPRDFLNISVDKDNYILHSYNY